MVDSEHVRTAHIIVLYDWPFGQIVNSTFVGLLHEGPFLSRFVLNFMSVTHVTVSTACRGLTVIGFWISATRVIPKRLASRSPKGKSNRFRGSVRFNRPLSIQLDSQRSTNTLEYNCFPPSVSLSLSFSFIDEKIKFLCLDISSNWICNLAIRFSV